MTSVHPPENCTKDGCKDCRPLVDQIPEDIKAFLETMTSFREEINSGTPNEWGEYVREEADVAAALCEKYDIVYHKDDEYDAGTDRVRQIFSDGTTGDWE